MSSRIVKFMKGNTIAMIALFIALGGTASAATLAANSVGSKQLKKKRCHRGEDQDERHHDAEDQGRRRHVGELAAGAVTRASIAAGAVTGDKVKVATLPKVPLAANADTLGGVSSRLGQVQNVHRHHVRATCIAGNDLPSERLRERRPSGDGEHRRQPVLRDASRPSAGGHDHQGYHVLRQHGRGQLRHPLDHEAGTGDPIGRASRSPPSARRLGSPPLRWLQGWSSNSTYAYVLYLSVGTLNTLRRRAVEYTFRAPGRGRRPWRCRPASPSRPTSVK